MTTLVIGAPNHRIKHGEQSFENIVSAGVGLGYAISKGEVVFLENLLKLGYEVVVVVLRKDGNLSRAEGSLVKLVKTINKTPQGVYRYDVYFRNCKNVPYNSIKLNHFGVAVLKSTKPKAQTIFLEGIPSAESFFTPTGWVTYSFSPEWFADALKEARTESNHHSRRREIIFAVCCVESYLFEWIRDEVLNRDFDKLKKYLPINDGRGICHRWKEITKDLKKDNQISNAPNCGLPYWEDFQKLVDYRNGLVHGKSSRPETSSLEDDQKPIPSKTELDKLPAGWAINVVIQLIRHLHEAVETSNPKWLVEP